MSKNKSAQILMSGSVYLVKRGIKIRATCCTKTKYAWVLQITVVDFIGLYNL